MKYFIEECEACLHGTRFPSGMYCFALDRYISEDEAYPNSCGQFFTQQDLMRARPGGVVEMRGGDEKGS